MRCGMLECLARCVNEGSHSIDGFGGGRFLGWVLPNPQFLGGSSPTPSKMSPEPPDRPPQTANEWGILVILSGFFGLFLLVDLAQGFTVQKLSVPFFFLSWVILLLVHEAGHAMMAGILGWRVERICIGTGRVRYRRVCCGVPIEFRTIPLSGFVVPRPIELRAARLKLCLIYAAGPGIELLAVAVLGWLLGPDTLLRASSSPAMIAAQSFSVAALLGAGLNLIPLSHSTQQGAAWSDGLGMIAAWGLREVDWRRLRDSDRS